MPATPDLPVTISVLVPAYNAASTIGDALESLLTQQPPVHEIIVSDDGSADDLDAALRPFVDRIALVRGPNEGLATARNRAAARATGSVLALLDADDIWLPGRSAAFVDAFRDRPDLEVVTTDAFVVREGVRDRETYYATRTWEDADQLEAILRENFIFGAGAVRRPAFERVGGYRAGARAAEDWDLWIRLLASGCRAGLVDAPLYEYRRRSTSLTRQRVDLAERVVATLEHARVLPLDDRHRATLARTIGAWRLRAVREAVGAGDARAVGLVQRALGDRAALVVAGRRLLRPVRRVVTDLADRADPARFALRTPTADLALGVACVYRSVNADLVSALVAGVPATAAVRLWSLDEVPGDLASMTVGSGPGTRFELLNRLIDAMEPGDRRDALALCDDDVRFVTGDIGRLAATGLALQLDLFQPAHSRSSYASRSTEALVRRRRLLLARRTGFVEQGPIVVLAASAQAACLPLPTDVGMGWGIDVRWARLARARGLALGVIDAVVIRHLVPPGGGYRVSAELARLQAELADAGVERVEDLQVEIERIGLVSGRRARRSS